ncbi:hypothetical protein RI367_004313 [Sorochytrium milnesiophthora]
MTADQPTMGDIDEWKYVTGDTVPTGFETPDRDVVNVARVYESASETSNLSDAIALLHLFVQLNWTGPVPQLVQAVQSPQAVKEQDQLALAELAVDSEAPYALTRHPAIFLLAQRSLKQLATEQNHPSAVWWYARALFVHQRLLDNPVGSLKDQLLSTMSSVQLPAAGDRSTKLLHATYHVEMAIIQSYYHQTPDVPESLAKAQALSGLQMQVTGMLGKRTKFQQSSFSQLVVLARSGQDDEDDTTMAGDQDTAVKTLSLDHEALLEKVALDDANDDATSTLHPLDQCILLALCGYVKLTNPADVITAEQMAPYARRVLENANNWTVHSMALLARSRLESDKPKTVERAVLQVQALVDQIPSHDSTAQERLRCFFQLAVPSVWELESELADKFLTLGMVRSALEIFERRELWEKAISCYMLIGQEQKAEKVILRLLDEKPKDPKLLCLLGDVRTDWSLYEEAWEVSGQRFSRAMRSLGAYYWSVKQLDKVVECLMKALRINPLFENSWFVCGCAAMEIQDWDTAVEAFYQCTRLDYENAEAWNNLASVYMQQKRNPEAYQAIQQALRKQYDSWKIWSNFMYLAVSMDNVDDAVQAMTRMVELRGNVVQERDRLIDDDVLQWILARALSTKDQPEAPHRFERLDKLLELIMGLIGKNERLWKLMKDYFAARGLRTQAYRCGSEAWRSVVRDQYDQLEQFEKVVDAVPAMIETHARWGDADNDSNRQERAISSAARYQAGMNIRALLRRGNDFEGSEAYRRLEGMLADLQQQ